MKWISLCRVVNLEEWEEVNQIMLKVMFLGEIVGLSTVKQINKKLDNIINKYKINFTLANADGASDGYGILRSTAFNLHKSGIKAITSGNFIFNKKDARELLKLNFVLRPFNIPNALERASFKS